MTYSKADAWARLKEALSPKTPAPTTPAPTPTTTVTIDPLLFKIVESDSRRKARYELEAEGNPFAVAGQDLAPTPSQIRTRAAELLRERQDEFMVRRVVNSAATNLPQLAGLMDQSTPGALTAPAGPQHSTFSEEGGMQPAEGQGWDVVTEGCEGDAIREAFANADPEVRAQRAEQAEQQRRLAQDDSPRALVARRCQIAQEWAARDASKAHTSFGSAGEDVITFGDGE